MPYNPFDPPKKVRRGGKTLEVITLEQLYIKCSAKVKHYISNLNSADELLDQFDVALREECHTQLDKLMKPDNAVGKAFADDCIKIGRSPVEARIAAYSGGVKTGKCYWPDCP